MEEGEIVESSFNAASEDPQLDQEPLMKCGEQPVNNGCFRCNICLDFAADPVATLCGHLYCWPCIYKWLQVQTEASQQCAVCKTSISESELVPLYGRGKNAASKDSNRSMAIPRRPCVRLDHHVPQHQQRYPETSNDMRSSLLMEDGPMINSMISGGVGGIAVAVLPRAFFSHETDGYQSNVYYRMLTAANPRLRRQEMGVGRSLHQIWLFLLCCVLFCLFFR